MPTASAQCPAVCGGSRLVGELLFVDNFMPSFGAVDPIWITGHLWTLSFEEQVYLLIPVLFWSARRLGVARAAWAALAIRASVFVCGWQYVDENLPGGPGRFDPIRRSAHWSGGAPVAADLAPSARPYPTTLPSWR